MDHDTSILTRLKEEARLRHQNALDSRGANGAMSLKIRMSFGNCVHRRTRQPDTHHQCARLKKMWPSI
jgi:hypothetical protein